MDTVVALFAVLRTGAAYLPLDLDHPADRLRLMVEDTGPMCLLSTTAVAPTLRETPGALAPEVLLDDPAVAAALAALPRRRSPTPNGPRSRTAWRTGSNTPPTSSTPPARPAGPRASSRPTAA
ncbi:AMP-binding protein [Streptomyces stramineus]